MSRRSAAARIGASTKIHETRPASACCDNCPVPGTERTERRRAQAASFGAVAATYERARPSYPARVMTRREVIDLVASRSYMIMMEPAARAEVLDRVRHLLANRGTSPRHTSS